MAKTVQHTKLEMTVAASTFPTLQVLGLPSITTEADGNRGFHNRKGADSHHRYALERTVTDIKIFFWSRHASSVPVQVESPHEVIEPDTWVRACGRMSCT